MKWPRRCSALYYNEEGMMTCKVGESATIAKTSFSGDGGEGLKSHKHVSQVKDEQEKKIDVYVD